MGTDDDWAMYGKDVPYCGVLGDEAFRAGNLSDPARDRFFLPALVQRLAWRGLEDVLLDIFKLPERVLDSVVVQACRAASAQARS